MFKNLFPVYHSEDDGLDIGGTNEDEDFSGGDDELFSAIQDLIKEDEDEDEAEEEVEESEEDDTEEESNEDEELEEEEYEQEEEETTTKKQSKEENAKFAAKRRQAEIDRQVEERLKQSPEHVLAKQLSEMYGRPVEQIIEEMKEAALQKEAKESGVSVDNLRKERAAEERANNLEAQINQLKFENWQSKINADKDSLKKEYTMLSDKDMDSAVNYILNVVRNVDMPLEEAVYAVHGKKIVQALAKSKVQDDLANQSGRKKKTPPSPNNGKASKASAELTADEKYMAKQFGMTADEYIKFRE